MTDENTKSAKVAFSVAVVLFCLVLAGLWAVAAGFALFVLVACLEDIRLTIARK